MRRPVPGGGEEQRKAEVLSVRDKQKPMYQLAIPRDANAQETPEDKREYYLHWVEFNKRLDEWVAGSRLVLSRELEWPKPKAPPQPPTKTGTRTPTNKANQRRSGGSAALIRKATKGAAALAKAHQAKMSSHPDVSSPLANTSFTSSQMSPPLLSDMSLPGSPSPSPMTPNFRGFKRKAPDDEEDAEGEDDDGEGEEYNDAEGEMYNEQDADGEVDMDIDNEPDLDADGEAEDDIQPNAAPSPNGEGASKSKSKSEPTSLPNASDPRKPPAIFSKKQEIEKLRHGGSMTQAVHEIARVKNLNRLQIGQHEVESWYFSPYPVEYAHLPVLYICEFCLSYWPSPKMFERHRAKCTLMHPPGNEIYRHDGISFWEIDGKRQMTWCRNLSLLSKCFLDQYVRFLSMKVLGTDFGSLIVVKLCIMMFNRSFTTLWYEV